MNSTVEPIEQPNLKNLEQFVHRHIRDDAAEPHPDELFDAAMEGHFELPGSKSKSGNPVVWSGENIIGTINFTLWNSMA